MKQLTREKIQEKAIALFLEKGYEQTTIMDICEACDITKRTFYYHYPAKSDVLMSIRHELSNRARQALLDEIANPSNLDKIWIIMSKYCVGGEEYGPDVIKHIYLQSLENKPDDHFPIDTEMYHVVIQLIHNAVIANELKTSSTEEQLAFILYHAFRSVTITWAFEHGQFSLQDAYLKCFNTILNKNS